jgi:Zn-dependent peptidase ImmA (M78 family)/transcriptional regulator with XRE-family HTH domain
MARPVTTAALSQIEAGKVRPSAESLRDLADALDVPLPFFFAEWPDGHAGDVLSRVPYFRDLAATPSKQRRRAAALALLLSDLVAALELRIRLPKFAVPNFAVDAQAGRHEIEDVAQALRGEWNLGDEPIPHVVRVIERHGVLVARLALGERSVDAFSVRFAHRPLILLTDDKSNYVRSRFDAGHELGHLVMHGKADPNDRAIERQAHDFAASFLLPEAVARNELPYRVDSRGWAKLADLKREWGISISALLYRARDLGILTPDGYRNAMKYISARGWRTTEPGDREMGLPEAPALFERALRTIEVEYDMSREDVVRSAHLPLVDTLGLIDSSSDQRPTIQL